MTSENGAPAVIPTYAEGHPTNNSPEGHTSTTQVEITPQQLYNNDKNMTPSLRKLYIKDEQLKQDWPYLKGTI
jgi:hypothetical protein